MGSSFPVLIPAAGRGTRLRPITEYVSKAMLPLGSTPLIDVVIKEAVEAGAAPIVVVGSPDDEALRRYLDDHAHANRIRWAVQSSPDGLADALLEGYELLSDDVAAMMLPDNIILGGEGLGDLMDYQPEEDEVVWGKTMVSRRAAHYFGNSGDYRPVEPKPTDVESVVGLQPKEEGYFVDRDLEWPAPRLIGRVLLPPRFFEIAQSADPDPRTGELDDVPIFRRLLESRPGRAIPVSGDVYDAGEPDTYLRLAADYFQRSGVRHDD